MCARTTLGSTICDDCGVFFSMSYRYASVQTAPDSFPFATLPSFCLLLPPSSLLPHTTFQTTLWLLSSALIRPVKSTPSIGLVLTLATRRRTPTPCQSLLLVLCSPAVVLAQWPASRAHACAHSTAWCPPPELHSCCPCGRRYDRHASSAYALLTLFRCPLAPPQATTAKQGTAYVARSSRG